MLKEFFDIHAAWEDGYYDEMISFMRQFYSEVLKSNEALEFAVLTGVLRVAKESIFSGLNNLRVCSVLSAAYRDVFGFTGAEVAKMAKDLGKEDKLPEIREWYDGYSFGGQEIYNPWSVIQYFQEGCTILGEYICQWYYTADGTGAEPKNGERITAADAGGVSLQNGA